MRLTEEEFTKLQGRHRRFDPASTQATDTAIIVQPPPSLRQAGASQGKGRLEKQVQDDVIAWLMTRGLPFSLTDATIAYNANGQRVVRVTHGWPDIVTLTGKGRFFAIECKREVGGKLSREQAATLLDLYEAGGLICIARSVTDVWATELLGRARPEDLNEIAKTMSRLHGV